MKYLFFTTLISFLLFSCSESRIKADLVINHAVIYTVNGQNDIAEAVAVKDGKIMAVGKTEDLDQYIDANTEVIDAGGKALFPGLIDGHAHFIGIGSNIVNVDLSTTKSFDELVEMVKSRAAIVPAGQWIEGRGWHQDKWLDVPEKMFHGFPTHDLLSEAIPDHPVVLSHASGHAVLVNKKAMEMAGISEKSLYPEGGEILKDLNGEPTGIFNEQAQLLIKDLVPQESRETQLKLLSLAQQECLQYGLTGLHDAGSKIDVLESMKAFAETGDLKMRLHVMVAGYDSVTSKAYLQNLPERGLYGDHLNIASVKLYADGALGSRGAWLLAEYEDAHQQFGHNTSPLSEIERVAKIAFEHGFQVCTHAIGDRANREVLDIYERVLALDSIQAADSRFRIEHAQHIDPADQDRFARLGVIPSMQAIHMSSDRPWAIDRLGAKRIEEGAYMWRNLIDQGNIIVNGTDAPVEPVNPFNCFYASVSRRTLAGNPEGGYEPIQKMTREEALRSYTIWPAFGAFVEDQVGSIEVGKYADFVLLDRDIMKIPEMEILETRAVMTIIEGQVVYSSAD